MSSKRRTPYSTFLQAFWTRGFRKVCLALCLVFFFLFFYGEVWIADPQLNEKAHIDWLETIGLNKTALTFAFFAIILAINLMATKSKK